MGGNKQILHIGTSAHFGGTAHEDAHLTGAHFAEQFLLPGFGVGVMDIGDFIGGKHGNAVHGL